LYFASDAIKIKKRSLILQVENGVAVAFHKAMPVKLFLVPFVPENSRRHIGHWASNHLNWKK